mmetsp:Transcript_79975/g.246664  ORF Transcript_79975/g.246664 Transcript_79975/m.246664 type:complete len:255 (-) Transcript_79975:1927-2691(-)
MLQQLVGKTVRGAEAFQLHHQEWRRSPDSLHLLMQILGVVPVSPLGALAAAGWDVLGLDRGAETLLQLHRRFAFLARELYGRVVVYADGNLGLVVLLQHLGVPVDAEGLLRRELHGALVRHQRAADAALVPGADRAGAAVALHGAQREWPVARRGLLQVRRQVPSPSPSSTVELLGQTRRRQADHQRSAEELRPVRIQEVPRHPPHPPVDQVDHDGPTADAARTVQRPPVGLPSQSRGPPEGAQRITSMAGGLR